jgi:hypothetical protein
MLNEKTCEGCKSGYYTYYDDLLQRKHEMTHNCSYLYKELVNEHTPELQCPCEECVVKAMCDWMSKQCCSLFTSEFLEKILPSDLKYTSTSSSGVSNSSTKSSTSDYFETDKFDKFYNKRKRNALYKHSKDKAKYKRYL